MQQGVISVPKRLRCLLADRPAAFRALTKISLAEIERLLCAAVGVTIDADALPASRPPFALERLSAIRVGQPLDGAPEPLKSVPPTAQGRRLRKAKRPS